jgi:tetratricopeptide (TPR) repeat protein
VNQHQVSQPRVRWRICLTSLLLIVESFWSSPSGALAEPIDGFNIQARKISPSAERLGEAKFIQSMTHPHQWLVVTSRLTPKDLLKAETNGIRSILLSDDASHNVLQNKGFLRKVQEVGIESHTNVETYLKTLAHDCPQLQSLYIDQTVPLSRESIQLLSYFKNLKNLQLACPAADSELVANSLPKTLEYLRIEEEYPLREFPRLQFLSVNYCRINHTFLETLRAPNLERLDFSWVDMETGSLKAIANLDNLKELQVYNSNIDGSELQYIQPLEYLETSIGQIYRKGTPYWSNFFKKAESSFKAGKFQDAITNYREIAFTRPATHLYLQLARSYLKVGYLTQAKRFRDLAQQLDRRKLPVQRERPRKKKSTALVPTQPKAKTDEIKNQPLNIRLPDLIPDQISLATSNPNSSGVQRLRSTKQTAG